MMVLREARDQAMGHVPALIDKALEAFGWTSDRAYAGRPRKQFQTAVGEKTAQAYCHPCSEGGYVLTGEYWSEGHNALSTVRFGLPADADDQTICTVVAAFDALACAYIDETYARGLFLRWPKQREIASSI